MKKVSSESFVKDIRRKTRKRTPRVARVPAGSEVLRVDTGTVVLIHADVGQTAELDPVLDAVELIALLHDGIGHEVLRCRCNRRDGAATPSCRRRVGARCAGCRVAAKPPIWSD